MLNKFRNYLESLGYSFNKELTLIIISNILCLGLSVALILLTKQLFIGLSSLLSLILVNGLIFYRYSNKKKEIIDNHEDEFVTIISYFQIFINNNCNVYQSFQNTLSYSSDWMQEKIQLLLLNIDRDKTVKPFVDFAKNFHNAIAHNVMLSIYQMIDEGESGAHMVQFSILFDQLSHSQHKARLDNKDKSLGSLSTFHLIGAGLITLLITFGIITIMGDMINVL